MPVVSWALDASQVLAGSAQFQAAMANINGSVASAMTAMVNFNNAQGQFEQTIQGVLASGDKFQARFNAIPGSQNLVDLTSLKLLGEEFQTVEERGKNAGNSIFVSWQRIGGVIQLQLWRQLIRGLEQAFTTGIAGASEFEMQISRIRTVAQDSDISFNQWAQHIHDLSDKYGIAQKDVADSAITALTSQTAEGASAIKLLDSTLQFASVTMLSAKDATTLVTSALNSFQISAENATHAEAVLFETMNLGHIQGQQIASSMGRVNEMAHTLGLTLEETGAALATLTGAGVKPTEAMTLLSAVMEKMIRPSVDMKKLLESWGTPTGEAAFATFGFVGVLNKLQEASHGSVTELANLFNQVRSSKGIQGLTLFSGYQENLEKIKTTADQAYDAAKKITEESPGRNLEKEWVAIKNFFVDDFGRAFIHTMSEISDSVGGFHNVIIQGTKIIGAAAAAWILYKSGILNAVSVLTGGVLGISSANVELLKMSANLIVGARNFAELRLGLATFGSQLAAIAIPLAGFIALSYALYKVLYDTGEQAGKASENLGRLREQAIKQTPVNLGVNQAQENANDYKEVVSAVFGALLQQTSVAHTKISALLGQLRDRAKEMGEELITSFKTYMSRLQEEITEFRRAITEARAELQSSLTHIEKFKETVSEAKLQEQLKFATPAQAYDLLTDKLARMTKQIKELYATATKESVAAARQTEADALRVISEIEAKKKEYVDAMAKNQGPAVNNDMFRQGQVGPYKGPSDEYYSRVNKLLRDSIGLETEYQRVLSGRITKFTELEEKAKARVSNINQAAKDFFDLQKQFEKGDVYKNPKFQTETGAPDPQKAIAALEEAANRLRGLTQETDPQRALEFHAKLEAQKTDLSRIAVLERERITLESVQRSLQQQEALLKKTAQDQVDAAKKAAEDVAAEKTGGLDKIKADFKDLLIVANVEGDKVSQVLKGVFDVTQIPAIAESGPARAQLIADLTAAYDNMERLKKSAEFNTPAGIQKMRDGLDAVERLLPLLERELDTFIMKRTGTGLGAKDVIIPGGDNVTAVAALKDVTDQTTKMRASIDQAEQKMREFLSIKDIPSQIIKSSSKETQMMMLDLMLQSENTTNHVTTDFKNIATEIDMNIKKVQDLTKTIEALGKLQITIPQIAQPVNIPAPNPGLPADPFQGEFAFGGEVHGPRGSDNVPIWAQQGEFIVNADATKKFYSQLRAINDSVKPGYYSQGGYITTTVGDINVSMTSSGSPQYDVRSLAKLLRRELKRGTISFNH